MKLSLLGLAVLAVLGLGACGGGGGPISREAAGRLVVDKLVEDGDPTIVFSHPEQVDGESSLVVGRPLRLGEQTPIPIAGSSWFFWIDDEPGARFDHPTRFVLVDRSSGELTVHDAAWWPVLDGTPLWIDAADYWDEEQWVHGAGGARRGTLVPPEPPIELACEGGFGTAIVINGHMEGESGKEDFAYDAANMTQTLTDLGFTVTQAGEGTAEPTGHVNTWLSQKATELKAGDRLVVYITGHGSIVSEASQEALGRGEAGGMYSGLLEESLAKFDPGVEIIVIVDSCHSEAMLPELNCVADLAISAAREDQSSYSDIDSSSSLFGADDPDPEDQGGEFTSALARSMREIMDDPTQRQHVEDVAMQQGGSFMGALLTEAGLRARMYDFAYLQGKSEPQFRAGAQKTRPIVDPTPPVCDGDPGDSSSESTTWGTDEGTSSWDTDSDTDTGCSDAALADIAVQLGDILGADVQDAVCSGAQELPAANECLHSDGVKTSEATEEADWILQGTILGVDLPGDVPCGPGTGYDVVCTQEVLPIDGPAHVVYGRLAAPVDFAEPVFSYQYGFVFDTDGDPANDYVPQPQWPADFFAGTDLWLYAVHPAGSGWYAWQSSAANGFANGASSERIVVAGDLVALIVDADEVPAATARYRLTAFRHLGDYGQSMPWSGDVVPAVGEPLVPLQ